MDAFLLHQADSTNQYESQAGADSPYVRDALNSILSRELVVVKVSRGRLYKEHRHNQRSDHPNQ